MENFELIYQPTTIDPKEFQRRLDKAFVIIFGKVIQPTGGTANA